ncbi:MAG: FAD-dependent oxidoreductase [Armatimonadota bacterium]|nr:FAD-dependent oxidoreductase [Armatimonadota bacterium]
MKDNLEFDILIAGGGTAGCAAAIAAARRGHRVLLVEESNALGGASTTGGVPEWFASLTGLGDIFDRVKADLERFGAIFFGRFFNQEILKAVWQLMAEEAGVQILFHASLSGARVEDGSVREVSLLSCSRPLKVEAKYFLDCTGEGDLAFLAGAEFHQGHPETGRTLHMTLTCILYDTGQPVIPYLPPGLEPVERPEDLPGLNARIPLGDGRVYVNMTKVVGHDPTDPFSLSDAELEARRQLLRVVHYLQRTQYPTYTMASTGASIGIREGRRIVGDYILTEADILDRTPCDFPDGVAVATAQIDFHSLTRPGHVGWRQRVEPYAIPLRSLIARDFRNLLMAGKCISGDQVAQSSYRMTPTCCAMGQAAGTAAALAVERGVEDVRMVDVSELRRVLTADGMELDPRRHEAFPPVVEDPPDRSAAV